MAPPPGVGEGALAAEPGEGADDQGQVEAEEGHGDEGHRHRGPDRGWALMPSTCLHASLRPVPSPTETLTRVAPFQTGGPRGWPHGPMVDMGGLGAE